MLPVEDADSVVTVRVEDLVSPPAVPIMVEDCEFVTVLVVIVKFVLVAPAGTVTEGGTVAAAVLLLESATSVPPLGALTLSVTVPVTEVPPTTVV